MNVREAEEEEEEAAAAISNLRSQGCSTRKKRAEEGVISERREDGERGAGDRDIIQPYMAFGRRDR